MRAGPKSLDDPRFLRLMDLGPNEVIVVTCPCGWIAHYGQGFLQRHSRLASDTLIYDLQFRLRCKTCNRREGFTITLEDKVDGDTPRSPAPCA
jgi:hypothetical protein